MTDFRPDDHTSAAFRRGAGVPEGKAVKKGDGRKILSRGPDEVVLEDTWDGQTMRMRVGLDPKARTVTLDGQMGYHAVWRAEPDGDGTRLVVEGRMAPGGLFGLLLPLFKSRFLKQMGQDFAGHLEDLKESLGVGTR